MRTGKVLGIVVGGIVALCAVGLLAVWLLVNPNVYKPKIIALVKEDTGRDLTLSGDIKLSVFPWVALELGPTSLGNPPGFGSDPFLAVTHASVRVKLLPLLHKSLEVARVEIDGLDLRLRKNAAGQGNWEGLGRSQGGVAESSADRGSPSSLSMLGDIRVRDGRVSYQNVVIEGLNFETGGGDGGAKVIPVSLAFSASRGTPGEAVTVNAKLDVNADSTTDQLHFAAVNMSGLMSQPDDGRPAHWDLSAPKLEVDLKAQTVGIPEFAMSYSSARVTGKLAATKIIDNLTLAGSLTLQPVELREIGPRLGLTLPPTHDPKALGQLSGSSDFAYDVEGMKFSALQLRLDDTQVKGSAGVVWEPQTLKFDLAVDRIDVDRYLAGPGGSAEPAPASRARAAAAGATGPAGADAKAPAAKGFDVLGTLAVGAVHVASLDLTNLQVTLASKDGVARLYPLQAQIDGGRYSGDISFDRRSAVPVLSLDEHLSSIDMAKLLASNSSKEHLSGHGNVNLKATAHGATADAILKSMNGNLEAYVNGGAVEGIDLGYELARVEALVHKESPPARTNLNRTSFDTFKTTAQISSGVATTHDLTIASQALKVTGQGTANLASKALDLQILATILRSATSTMADVPLRITGTYVDPKVNADLEALAKGQIKQKLQDVLKKNGLEGLFGK